MKTNCKNCYYHSNYGGCAFCTLLHYWPNLELIEVMGCADYEEDYESLLNFNGKEGRYIYAEEEK